MILKSGWFIWFKIVLFGFDGKSIYFEVMSVLVCWFLLKFRYNLLLYSCIYIGFYVFTFTYIANHQNNVTSQLSTPWLCAHEHMMHGNSREDALFLRFPLICLSHIHKIGGLCVHVTQQQKVINICCKNTLHFSWWITIKKGDTGHMIRIVDDSSLNIQNEILLVSLDVINMFP